MYTKRTFFYIFLSLFIVSSFLLGFFGIYTDVTLRVESCSGTYRHYIIQPFIRNWVGSLEVSESLSVYNAQMRIVLCLCNNKSQHPDSIPLLYQDAVRSARLNSVSLATAFTQEEFYVKRDSFSEPFKSYDYTTYICEKGAAPVLFL